jgi:carboxyl-terminal processing protease
MTRTGDPLKSRGWRVTIAAHRAGHTGPQTRRMALAEFVLAVYTVLAVLLLAARPRLGPRAWRGTAVVGVALVAIALAVGHHRTEAAPMSLAALGAVLIAFRRSRRPPPPSPARPGIVRATLRYGAALLVALAVVADAAFVEIVDPLSNTPLRELFGGPAAQDFSRLAWPDAFEKLHDHLSRAYAMGAWKRIDWKALHDATAPKIAAAALAHDRGAYYLALRVYLWSLHDGHVDLNGDDGGLRAAAIKGGYGLLLIRLDDGRTIVNVLLESGSAARQGMRWGATILKWNGIPVDEAAARTPIVWSLSPPATSEGVQLAQLKWLTRAPVGTMVTVVFRNPDESGTRAATLEAADDLLEPLRRAGENHVFTLTDPSIAWRILPEGPGYVSILAEVPTLPQLLPDRIFRRAIEAFVRAGVPGVLIDVRRNFGGADKLVPRMMGFFVDRRQLYEHATLYDDRTSRFERDAAGTMWTEPRAPHFGGPIAVLVDEWCVSSGEGFALIARQRPGARIVGFHGTYGSFGMSGAEVRMPGGLTVEFPDGQSLDANGVVQIDSDWRLEGGVAPDVRVPLTLETVRAQFQEGRDVVLEAAIKSLRAPR